VTGQLGEDPDAFTIAQRPGGVLTDDRVEELERLTILERGVFVADHAQHRVGALDQVARPAHHGDGGRLLPGVSSLLGVT
jgi:hypothetical protein